MEQRLKATPEFLREVAASLKFQGPDLKGRELPLLMTPGSLLLR